MGSESRLDGLWRPGTKALDCVAQTFMEEKIAPQKRPYPPLPRVFRMATEISLLSEDEDDAVDMESVKAIIEYHLPGAAMWPTWRT